jgi:O-antigen/teichoic acid export membrane protein
LIRVLGAQWLATFFIGGVSFLLTAFIARRIGPEAFGLYALALSAGSLVAILIDAGFRTLMLRERSRPSEYLGSAMHAMPGQALAHVLIASTGLALVSGVVLGGDERRLAVATVACFAVVTLNQITSSMLRGDGRLMADAGFSVGARGTTALAIFILLAAGGSKPWEIMSVWALAGLACLFPFRGLWPMPRLSGIKALYRAAFPLLITDLAITVYIRSDLILLDYFGIDRGQMGQFAAAFRICEGVVLVAGPVGLLVFRRIRLDGRALYELRGQIARLMLHALGLSLFLVATVWFFSEDIIGAVYGVTYPEAGGFLKNLSFMLLFVFPNLILNQSALATEQERWTVCAAILVAGANIVLLALLIPRVGVTAAVWSKVFAEASMCALMATILVWQGRRKARTSIG